ncbi:hypothetical protein HY412_02200 [Candidatus Kaiserbacteria bacterium]|nr:hypothetical protein [Candidatus Kaiserbacteria bacterium]
MTEAQVPGMGEWKKSQIETPLDFHLDTNKVDDVEKLIKKVGWDDALTQINDNFDRNPNDAEARRRATLIVRLYDEKVKPLRDKLQH